VLAGDWHNMNWVMYNFQVVWVTDVSHIEADLVAAHHMVSLVIKYPWANIFARLQKALVVNEAAILCHPKDAVGGEVAWGISCHCTDLQRPAWLHPRFHLSYVALKLGML
jgi:hypothetical protein